MGGVTAPLLSQLKQGKNALEDAHIKLCGVVTAHAEAKRALELAEATAICTGVEGKNEAQRAAVLRLQLEGEYRTLYEAEDALTEARCAYDLARLEWDLARYNVRVLEPQSFREAA